jgi:hypothetical protein
MAGQEEMNLKNLKINLEINASKINKSKRRRISRISPIKIMTVSFLYFDLIFIGEGSFI